MFYTWHKTSNVEHFYRNVAISVHALAVSRLTQ